MKSIKQLAAASALTGLASFAAPASAGLMLTLSDGTTNVSIMDGGAGDAAIAIPGLVTYIGAVGCFSINVTTGAGDAALPTLTGIDLNSINIATGCPVPTTLTMSLSQDGFSGGGHFNGHIGGTINNLDIIYAMYVDGSNALGGTGTQIGGGVFTQDGAYSASFGGDAPGLNDPYSMTLVVKFLGQQGSGSFDFEGTVPEPGSLALIGLALSGLGFVARRRHRQ